MGGAGQVVEETRHWRPHPSRSGSPCSVFKLSGLAQAGAIEELACSSGRQFPYHMGPIILHQEKHPQPGMLLPGHLDRDGPSEWSLEEFEPPSAAIRTPAPGGVF